MDFTRNLYPKLFIDYLEDEKNLKSYYRFCPQDENSYLTRYEEIKTEYSLDSRQKLVKLLSDYNETLLGEEDDDFSGKSQMKRSIEKLREENSVVVITGQQPGVLTGPLYNIYKAVSAIKLAKETERSLGIKAVPVFWLASEDHDVNEIDFINLRNSRGKLKRFNLFQQNYNSPIGSLEINKAGERLLDNIELYYNNCQDLDPCFEKWLDFYRASLRNSNNLTSWTARIMMKLLSKYGLLVIDPMLTDFRALSKDLFIKAVESKNKVYEEVKDKGESLEKLGYETPLSLPENHSGLFFTTDDNVRKSILYDSKEGRYKTINGEHVFDELSLKNMIEEEYTRFSPNVSLRPVVQDYIFPTLAYVAGPGEVSYFSQLEGVYKSFDVKMPVIYPRERYVIIEPSIKSAMERYEIGLEDVFLNWKDKRNNVLDSLSSLDIEGAFEQASKAMKSQHEELIEKLSREFPQVKDTESKNWKHIHKQLEYLKDKVRQYNNQNNKEIRKSLDRVKLCIFPHDKHQERFYSMGEYLLFYDARIITEIMAKELNSLDLQIVEL